MRVTVVLGTRPEVIKLAPVVANLRERGAEVRVVHTGQHTDSALATGLESECRLSVDTLWQLPDDSAARLGHVFEYALNEFATNATDAAIVLGDTWTVPLIGMAARSNGVPVVHVEAGLRSHNLRSQEEVNRRAAVACARLHLAPTMHAERARFALSVSQRERSSLPATPSPMPYVERALRSLHPINGEECFLPPIERATSTTPIVSASSRPLSNTSRDASIT